MNYVAYTRVSTKKQDYGITAQTTDINNFIKNTNGILLAEYTEKESGRSENRTQLNNAVEYCLKNNAILIVSKLDRLSRNIKFLFTLKESGVKFLVVDNPDLNTLTLGIFATVAQHEAEIISKRTVAGLKVAKAKGVILGRVKGSKLDNKHITNISNSLSDYHKSRLKVVTDFIEKNKNIHNGDCNIILNLLNNNGYKTRQGNNYTIRAVKNIIKAVN